MARYNVDVKAFIQVTVEAEDEDAARSAAEEYVGVSLSPGVDEWAAWNLVQSENGVTTSVVDAGCFEVDGDSDVEPEGEDEK